MFARQKLFCFYRVGRQWNVSSGRETISKLCVIEAIFHGNCRIYGCRMAHPFPQLWNELTKMQGNNSRRNLRHELNANENVIKWSSAHALRCKSNHPGLSPDWFAIFLFIASQWNNQAGWSIVQTLFASVEVAATSARFICNHLYSENFRENSFFVNSGRIRRRRALGPILFGI